MPRLLVIHHLERPFLGHAARPLEAAGLELDHRELVRGHELPAAAEVDGIVAFGGEQSVREIARIPYLQREAELFREAAAAGVPVLGVCLGGQVLAHALGGEVTRLSQRMVAWPEVERLSEADGDPVFGGLPQRFRALHWNEDSFSAPPGAVELLARAGAGVEAFRRGPNAWGIQFHPEADSDGLEDWYEQGAAWLAEAGVSEEKARAADRRHMSGQPDTANVIFGGFAAAVREHWTNARG